MRLFARLRIDRAWFQRYSRLGPGWYEADRVSQDEIQIYIPGRPPVAGETADFEIREMQRASF